MDIYSYRSHIWNLYRRPIHNRGQPVFWNVPFLKVQLGLDSVWAGPFLYYEEIAIEAAEQWPVPDEPEDVDRQEQEQKYSYFGMDHGTAVALYEEQEVAGKVEEEEPTGVSEGSVVVRGY